jgi:NAD(P)-dependent dehydrogenase (short-subunit alcohol dehydrogenase family)
MAGVELDVCDADDVARKIKGVHDQFGSIDILVNNAGVLVVGAVTDVPLDQVRLQFETNVVSIVSMVQAVVPGMIRKRSGRIVNMGSASGILPSPFSGIYCASKAAVHALSDVLRAELAPFGIKVITVKSGGVVSSIGDNALRLMGQMPTSSPYARLEQEVRMRASASQAHAKPVKAYAHSLVTRVLADKPKATIRLGDQSRLLPFLRTIFPEPVRDAILTRKFGLDALRQEG